MLNAQQHVHTNSSFRSNIANSEYEEVLAEYYPAEYEGLVAEYHPTEYEEVIAEYHSTEYEEVVAECHSTENEEVVAEYHPTEYEEVVAEYQSTEYEELVAEYHPTVYEEVVTEYHPTEYEEVVAEYHSIEYEEVVAEYHSTEYLEVVAEYHLTEYEEAHSIQRANTSNAVHIAVLWLLCLIIICSLIAIVLTGVVTFLVTRKTLPKTKCHDAEEINCYWSSWSSWYKCSGIGIQIRIKQQMSNTTLCSKNETFDSKICSRGECTDFDWMPWSNCNNGVKIRIKQKMFNARICGFNENFKGQNCSGEDDLFDMRFSRTALYKYWFISADNTIISNVQTRATSSSADAQLQNYMGTIADICVGDNELIYYEVNYTYTIVKALIDKNFILEVGLAERAKVDRFHYVGTKHVSGWSFLLHKSLNNNKVFLYSEDAGSWDVFESFGNNTIGTTVHGKFKLFINRRRKEFSLRHDDSIFHVLAMSCLWGLQSSQSSCQIAINESS